MNFKEWKLTLKKKNAFLYRIMLLIQFLIDNFTFDSIIFIHYKNYSNLFFKLMVRILITLKLSTRIVQIA